MSKRVERTAAVVFALNTLKMSTWPWMRELPQRPNHLAKLKSSCRSRGRNSVPGATMRHLDRRRGQPGVSVREDELSRRTRRRAVGRIASRVGQEPVRSHRAAGVAVARTADLVLGRPPGPGPVVVVRPSGRPARSCHVPLTEMPQRQRVGARQLQRLVGRGCRSASRRRRAACSDRRARRRCCACCAR